MESMLTGNFQGMQDLRMFEGIFSSYDYIYLLVYIDT